MLSADELPKSLMMSNNNIHVDILELKTEIANLRTGEPFPRKTVSSQRDETRRKIYNSINEAAQSFLFI